jgi:hypothetical protein
VPGDWCGTVCVFSQVFITHGVAEILTVVNLRQARHGEYTEGRSVALIFRALFRKTFHLRRLDWNGRCGRRQLHCRCASLPRVLSPWPYRTIATIPRADCRSCLAELDMHVLWLQTATCKHARLLTDLFRYHRSTHAALISHPQTKRRTHCLQHGERSPQSFQTAHDRPKCSSPA